MRISTTRDVLNLRGPATIGYFAYSMRRVCWRGPKSKVPRVALPQKRVEFCNSIIDCLFSEMARVIGTVQNLIIEYREVCRQQLIQALGQGALGQVQRQ